MKRAAFAASGRAFVDVAVFWRTGQALLAVRLLHPSLSQAAGGSRRGSRERKKVRNTYVQAVCNLLSPVKRWRVDASLDQAEEVNRNADDFCELFLRKLA
jgi:hypothetical protein